LNSLQLASQIDNKRVIFQ